MAPGQARGEAIDPRTDLFSLGSVLYAMCTGHPPFRAETPMAVLHRVCEDTPRPVREFNPEIPDWLEAIIERLHAKDPADRFGTAAEVATLLDDCLAHVQDPRAVRPAQHPDPEAGRLYQEEHATDGTPWAIAAAALVLVLGVLGAAEATGSKVSALVATILRIPTRDGTLAPASDPAPQIADKPLSPPAAAPSPLVLDADPGGAWFAVFSADGATLATGGTSGILKLWERHGPPATIRRRGDFGLVRRAAFRETARCWPRAGGPAR